MYAFTASSRTAAARWMISLSAWGMLAAGWSPTADADLPTAQLTTIFPCGAKQGSSVEVTVGGAHLDDADRLLFSLPGISASPKLSGATEFEKEKPIPGVFTVTVAPDVPAGMYEVRAVGRFGISNPRVFVVGTLEEVLKAGGNNVQDKAQEVKPGQIVNGRTDGNSMDFYKFSLKPGERILIDCRAQRLDSRLDGTLVLFDSTGRELMRNRNLARRDPLLDFTASAEGTYTVALYDFVYGGGAEHFYRLAFHQGPHIDYVFPPSGLPGQTAALTLYGRNLPGGQPAPDVTVNGRPLEKLPLSLTLPADEVTRQNLAVISWLDPATAALDAYAHRADPLPPFVVYYAHAPVITEQEPNSKTGEAQKITVPSEFVGQFYPQGDEDWLQFDAKKGERYVLDVFAHRLGMGSDPFLLIQKVNRNEKGEETLATVAQVDDPGDRAGQLYSDFDTSTDDPTYTLDVPEDGTYRVMVRNQAGGPWDDARSRYRVAIRQPAPDFELVAGSRPLGAPFNAAVVPLGGSCVRRGGSTVIPVTVIRRDGFDGEITVSVDGLPAGLQCPPVILSPAVTEVPLIITAAEDAARWEGFIRIAGKAKLGEQEVTRQARAAATVWGTANRAQQPPVFRVTRELALAVIDVDTEAAAIQVAAAGILETSRGGKLDVPLKIIRRGDFKGDLSLVPLNLPNELKPANLAVKGDQAEINLPLAITNNNAKPGLYTFYLRADTKVKHVRNPAAQAAAEAEQQQADAKLKEITAANQAAVTAKDTTAKEAQAMQAVAKTAETAKATAEAAVKAATEAAQAAAAASAAAKQQADANAGNQDLANAAAAAEKAKTEADTKLTAATTALAEATKTYEDATAKAKAAEEAKAAAEKAAAELDAKLKAITAFKQAIDKRVEELKKANAPTDTDVAFVSTPIQLRVVDTPLQLTVPANVTAKAGEKPEIEVTLARQYGFDGPVEITLEAPPGVTGVSVPKLTVAKEQTAGKLMVTLDPKATPGDHTFTVRAKSQFNNVNVEKTVSLPVKVEAAAP